MAERSDWLASVRALYQEYLETVSVLEKNRKIGEGIFGLKGGPKDDPCHDRFIEDLAQLLKSFLSSEPSSQDISDVLSYIYTVPLENRNQKSAYWMLLAAHGLSLDLIAELSSQDASKLYDSYASSYPRWERLPVQKEILSRLKGRR